MGKQLTKAELEKQKVLAFLDNADSEVPENPGLFSETRSADEFAKLFEASTKEPACSFTKDKAFSFIFSFVFCACRYSSCAIYNAGS